MDLYLVFILHSENWPEHFKLNWPKILINDNIIKLIKDHKRKVISKQVDTDSWTIYYNLRPFKYADLCWFFVDIVAFSLKTSKVLSTLLENGEPARYHRRHLWMSQKGHTSALTSTGMSQTWLMDSVCLNGKSLSLSLKPVRWSNCEHLKQEKSRPTQRDYTFRFIHSSWAIWTPKVWVTHWYLHVRKPLFKLHFLTYLYLPGMTHP